ncbi:MAG: DUF4956 domain-containing protein [Bacillota bacterium]
MGFRQIIDGFNQMSQTNNFNSLNVVSVLLVTFFLSLIIFFTYRKNYNNIAYNYQFNASLVILPLITSTIIFTISSNLVLSLGMVGALSIVRFRTAIKDPMDIVYLFWAIVLGLTTGAELFLVATIGSIFISLIIFFIMRFKNQIDIFLLVINYDKKIENEILDQISKLDYTLKSKRYTNNIVELTLELEVISSDLTFLDEIDQIDQVENVSLISYNGDFIE